MYKPQLVLFSSILLVNCCSSTSREMYDLSRLESLNAFEHSSRDRLAGWSDYLLVLYFNGSACDSCINRDLLNVADTAAEEHPRLSVLVIAHYDDESRHHEVMLRNLRRVGRLTCRVLLEGELGQAGLGTQMRVALIDTRTSLIVRSYHPRFSRDEWPNFQHDLQRTLSEK